jgi:hypothetical protein
MAYFPRCPECLMAGGGCGTGWLKLIGHPQAGAWHVPLAELAAASRPLGLASDE